MSVLKKFFEIALLLTFIIFTINLLMFFFGETFIPTSDIPLAEMTSDTNTIFGDDDINQSFVLQTTSISTRPINLAYVGNAVATLSIGFPLKIVAIFSPYGTVAGNIGIFIGLILGVIQAIGIIYLILAAIGTPIGGSVP